MRSKKKNKNKNKFPYGCEVNFFWESKKCRRGRDQFEEESHHTGVIFSST
jgi:hypothetical protein